MMVEMNEYRCSLAIFIHLNRIRGQTKSEWNRGWLGGLVQVHREWAAAALGQQVHRVADATDEIPGFK